MATRPVLTEKLARGVTRLKWTALTGTDDGAPGDVVQYPDKSVQLLGTFGGGTVLIEGSNDGGTTWATCNDAGTGAALSFTAPGIKQILENPQRVRPRASVGVTTVDCYITCHGDR